MYEILRQSMLNLNHHIDVTGAYAGNARLFEWELYSSPIGNKNLQDMREPGKEVVWLSHSRGMR